jgi:transposase
MELKQRRKRFDDDFKISAVKMVLEGTKSMASIAQDLGINSNTLLNWKKKYMSGSGNTTTYNGKEYFEDPEKVALRKELAYVKMQRDFLKKAAAFFAANEK